MDHIRKLARTAAAATSADLGVVSSVLVQKWSSRLSVALQKANAANIRRACGEAPGPDELLEASLAD